MLAESGADSMTFYETSGWCGVMETAAGCPLPELYHVLADIGDFAGGEVVATDSGRPLELVSLLLRKGGRRRLMLANLTPSPQQARLPMPRSTVISRVLDSTTVHAAKTRPEAFRACLTPWHGPFLVLAPHALVTMDFPDA